MQAEIEAYEYQLSQVHLALDADPTNTELVSLKGELEELISLTKMASGSAVVAVPTSSSGTGGTPSGKEKGKGKETGVPSLGYATSVGEVVVESSGSPASLNRSKFKAGDECTAKYKDGKWFVIFLFPFCWISTPSPSYPNTDI
jgi:survival of motor neuron-related-splicing factor 30